MASNLLKILKGLRIDPNLAVDLYKQLYDSSFWVLVQQPVVNIESMMFLNYPTLDGIHELPLFSDNNLKTLKQLHFKAPDSEIVSIKGHRLWPRMLNIVETGKCEVAVDPGEDYGIRLTWEMILGMVNEYGSNEDENANL